MGGRSPVLVSTCHHVPWQPQSEEATDLSVAQSGVCARTVQRPRARALPLPLPRPVPVPVPTRAQPSRTQPNRPDPDGDVLSRTHLRAQGAFCPGSSSSTPGPALALLPFPCGDQTGSVGLGRAKAALAASSLLAPSLKRHPPLAESGRQRAQIRKKPRDLHADRPPTMAAVARRSPGVTRFPLDWTDAWSAALRLRCDVSGSLRSPGFDQHFIRTGRVKVCSC